MKTHSTTDSIKQKLKRIENEFDHTLANRRAANNMLAKAAARGEQLSLMTESLVGLAGSSGFFVMEPIDYSLEPWDDIRPF